MALKETLHDRQFYREFCWANISAINFTISRPGTTAKFAVAVYESCRVTDLQITNAGVMLATNLDLPSETFDLAVIATGTSGLMKKKQPERIFPARGRA